MHVAAHSASNVTQLPPKLPQVVARLGAFAVALAAKRLRRWCPCSVGTIGSEVRDSSAGSGGTFDGRNAIRDHGPRGTWGDAMRVLYRLRGESHVAGCADRGRKHLHDEHRRHRHRGPCDRCYRNNCWRSVLGQSGIFTVATLGTTDVGDSGESGVNGDNGVHARRRALRARQGALGARRGGHRGNRHRRRGLASAARWASLATVS